MTGMKRLIWVAACSSTSFAKYAILRRYLTFASLFIAETAAMASADVLPAASSWEGLKKEADTAFGKGHYAQAVTYYGQAIDLASKSKTDEPARAKLFANRALTYQRAGEHTYPLLSDPSSPRFS